MVQKVKILSALKILFAIHELFINCSWTLQICLVDNIDKQLSIYMCKLSSLTFCPL